MQSYRLVFPQFWKSQTPEPTGYRWAEIFQKVGPVKMAENLLEAGMKATNGRNGRQKEDGKADGKQRGFFALDYTKRKESTLSKLFYFSCLWSKQKYHTLSIKTIKRNQYTRREFTCQVSV